jgi:mannosyltransferase
VTDHLPEALLLGALTAGALALRFLGLSEGDFWVDELLTLAAVDNSPGDVGIAVVYTQTAPHLYYLLAWAWSGMFGEGEAGLRSLSAIAGAFVAPAAYLTLRQLGMRTEALIAGALAAVSPLLIWYSQEARAYSLYALLTAVSLLFFVRLLVDWNQRVLIAWSIASVAALLTHYFALSTIAGMAIVLLYRHRTEWRSITLSLVPTAVAGFALLPVIAAQTTGEKTGWIAQIPLPERLLQLPEHFLTGFAYPPLAVVLLAGLLAATAGVGVLMQGEQGRLVGTALLGVVAVCIGISVFAKALGTDFVNSRNLVGAVVPLFLAVGVGLGARRLRPVGPIVALALVGLLAVTSVAAEYDDEVERPPWGAAADAIAEEGDPDMVLACCGALAAAPAQHYLGRFESYDPRAMGEVEVKQVVLATIRRPDHRPENDFCWWGSPCQADDVLGPGGPPAYPRELSKAFAAVFDHVETLTRGSITLERYQSDAPVSLGPHGPIRLLEDDVVVVGDDRAVNSVEVLLSPGFLAK